MVVASVGTVDKTDIITGEDIKPGDPIIGLASSGLHSNGITLARKILFKTMGRKISPHRHPRRLGTEVGLKLWNQPKSTLNRSSNWRREVKIKAAVHITGDAYTKFNNLTRSSPGIGFEFDNFNPNRSSD